MGGKGYKATISYTIKIMNTESGSYINNGTQTFSSESKVNDDTRKCIADAINTTEELSIEYNQIIFPTKYE
jgi:nucleoside-specific outer membrane channel protein Tsx